ncbi:hypothetical protein C8034_v007485 [Colletotrichum sidae]|uniref:NTF2-like domain-containing protein n=1 Tax=Colletotrichum sidae TaxID=1347389 RepID=A0A4R8TR27_9PEZI|nr:hypothetical protein C8034_v007485 [Colletotrichum sidae]
MHLFRLFPVALTAFAATASARVSATNAPRHEVSCLCEDEAWDIARRWLRIFSTNGVSGKEEVAAIVSANLTSQDNTFGKPTYTLDEFWDAISAPGNKTTTNVTQVPAFLLHTCDQIAFNWKYDGVTTGFNSTVPPGTAVAFTGNDILRVDLETRLISNATSCGDWILLARQLGGSCTL